MKKTVDGTGNFTLIFIILDFLVTAHVRDEAPKTCIAHQLGHLSQDLLVWDCIGGATRSGNKGGKGFKPEMGLPLDHSMHASHHQPFLQTEFQ